MKREISKILQVAAVFIGTIVGAGLASGKEITQFFTTYGYKSFIGIIITGIIYIYICSIIGQLSIKYNLSSYSEVIELVNSKDRNTFIGRLTSRVTATITTLYILSSASIILAGCGSLINQYFGIPKLLGTLLMVCFALAVLWQGTDGLIGVNAIIVPSLIIIIVAIMLLYIFFYKDIITVSNIKSFPAQKPNWLLSCILYAGYNILSCSGVLVPLSKEIKSKKAVTLGIILGSIVLTVLCIFINLMLMLNQPNIYQYDIPLLYITNRFSAIVQIALLIIIWLEMFSTEVSDVYSISKTLESTFKLSFRKCIFVVLAVAIPISQLGFSRLIGILYPLFGVLSLFFIGQCLYFHYSNK